MTLRALLLAVLVCASCGAGHAHHSTPDAGEPDASAPDAATAFSEALPSSLPQLVSVGGSVLTAPKVQPIFFSGDSTVQAQIEDFEAQLAGSSYWTAAANEYGVGKLTVLPTIVTSDPPPTTDAAVATFLSSHLDGTHTGWTYDPDVIYSLFLPEGTVVTSPDGSKSCQDYGAYHDEATGTNHQSIVYALLPRCTGWGPVLDELTEAASHEWLEAATDPRVETTPAYGDADPDHYVWAYLPGSEVGDYCEVLEGSYQKLVGNYMVQRTWSNAAARAGHDPCVPAPTTSYVAAAPVLTDDASIDGHYSGPVTTKAVKVPVGMSRTIDVQLFSDQPTQDFTVSAIDVASDFEGSPAELTFQWDRTTGHNGDVLHLTITRAASGTMFDGSEFAIATAVGRTTTYLWWGFASN